MRISLTERMANHTGSRHGGGRPSEGHDCFGARIGVSEASRRIAVEIQLQTAGNLKCSNLDSSANTIHGNAFVGSRIVVQGQRHLTASNYGAGWTGEGPARPVGIGDRTCHIGGVCRSTVG